MDFWWKRSGKLEITREKFKKKNVTTERKNIPEFLKPI